MKTRSCCEWIITARSPSRAPLPTMLGSCERIATRADGSASSCRRTSSSMRGVLPAPPGPVTPITPGRGGGGRGGGGGRAAGGAPAACLVPPRQQLRDARVLRSPLRGGSASRPFEAGEHVIDDFPKRRACKED